MTITVPADDETVRLAHLIASYLGSTPERVMKMAVALLAVDCGVKFELPRKETKYAG